MKKRSYVVRATTAIVLILIVSGLIISRGTVHEKQGESPSWYVASIDGQTEGELYPFAFVVHTKTKHILYTHFSEDNVRKFFRAVVYGGFGDIDWLENGCLEVVLPPGGAAIGAIVQHCPSILDDQAIYFIE
ncbi:hypothetical protein ACFL1M_03695 [Patescibacteria group bacterium]